MNNRLPQTALNISSWKIVVRFPVFGLEVPEIWYEARSTVKTVKLVQAIGASDRLRVREAAEIAHCSIGMVYVGIKEGWFKSWSVKRKGFERGTRYIDAKSFRQWLKSQREEISN